MCSPRSVTVKSFGDELGGARARDASVVDRGLDLERTARREPPAETSRSAIVRSPAVIVPAPPTARTRWNLIAGSASSADAAREAERDPDGPSPAIDVDPAGDHADAAGDRAPARRRRRRARRRPRSWAVSVPELTTIRRTPTTTTAGALPRCASRRTRRARSESPSAIDADRDARCLRRGSRRRGAGPRAASRARPRPRSHPRRSGHRARRRRAGSRR